MADYLVTDTELTSIANAIRTKGGTSASLEFPTEFVQAINDIQTGGGGASHDTELIMGTLSGTFENTEATSLKAHALSYMNSLTNVSLPNVAYVGANAFYNSANIETIRLPALRTASTNYIFSGIKKMTAIALPSITSALGGYAFSGDTLLAKADFGSVASFGGQCFANTALDTLIIRRTSVTTLGNINNFNNSPFASGKAGGTLYVPSSLISNYQNATNWSTILGYPNNSIQAIEGSQYENYYADGTPVE